jgi:hypothetical protein
MHHPVTDIPDRLNFVTVDGKPALKSILRWLRRTARHGVGEQASLLIRPLRGWLVGEPEQQLDRVPVKEQRFTGFGALSFSGE